MRRKKIDVQIDHDLISSLSFTLSLIKVAYRGHYRDVASWDTCEIRLLKPQERDRDENRADRTSRES